MVGQLILGIHVALQQKALPCVTFDWYKGMQDVALQGLLSAPIQGTVPKLCEHTFPKLECRRNRIRGHQGLLPAD
jgi:hypothetical protein